MRVRVRACRTADAGPVGLKTHWAGWLGLRFSYIGLDWTGFNKKEKNPFNPSQLVHLVLSIKKTRFIDSFNS